MKTGQVKRVFLAGGGTGGHIYPNLAVAEAIHRMRPDVEILYFCSSREIDARILTQAGIDFLPLPAMGLTMSVRGLVRFFAQYMKSKAFVRQILKDARGESCVLATGGFVSAPVVSAARELKIPAVLVNVDSVPGKANRMLAGNVRTIFVQFEQTKERYFRQHGRRVVVSGCPLRKDFDRPDAAGIRAELGLEEDRKVLLVTGASSGAQNINRAVLEILPELGQFAGEWQVVHLTGTANFEEVKAEVPESAIAYTPVAYCDRMADLLAAADLVVGRSGAVSVAEYMRAGKPAVCLPYPYHKDRHQYENARELVEAGAAVIVEDNPADPEQTAADLRETLGAILRDASRLAAMGRAMRPFARPDAAEQIAEEVLRDANDYRSFLN